jgi:ribosomal protein L14E/L6E/L27E
VGIDCEDEKIPVGALVTIKRGSYSGSVCVVLGIDVKDGRLLIADGRSISVKKPKRKNPRHVMWRGTSSKDVRGRLSEGKVLDDGWLCDILSRESVFTVSHGEG